MEKERKEIGVVYVSFLVDGRRYTALVIVFVSIQGLYRYVDNPGDYVLLRSFLTLPEALKYARLAWLGIRGGQIFDPYDDRLGFHLDKFLEEP